MYLELKKKWKWIGKEKRTTYFIWREWINYKRNFKLCVFRIKKYQHYENVLFRKRFQTGLHSSFTLQIATRTFHYKYLRNYSNLSTDLIILNYIVAFHKNFNIIMNCNKTPKKNYQFFYTNTSMYVGTTKQAHKTSHKKSQQNQII